MNFYVDSKMNTEFGQLLAQKNLIADEDFKRAHADAKSSGKPLIALVSQRINCDEGELYRLFCEKFGFRFESLKNLAVDSAVLKRVPIKVAWHYPFMPIKIEGRTVTLAVEYPLNIKTQDEIRLQLGLDIVQVLAKKKDILESLRSHYGFAADTVEKIMGKDIPSKGGAVIDDTYIEKIDQMAGDASVINLVNEIILEAYEKHATDIHFEPYRGQFRLRYRIDGILRDGNLPEKVRHLILPILSRIKIMASLDIVEHRLPQDGRAMVKISKQTLDLRISSIPTPNGESIVVRLLPTEMTYDLKKLGLTEKNIKIIESAIHKPNGIILLTGPTGSGKTTTLYAALNRINSKEKKIITIEDPVEYEIAGITQIQVLPKVGLDFARGLRSMLRHDPDVMMVGEIRDLETAEIAIRSALTGHLVFSTLHTNDAASGITRLIDIGVEPFLVGSSIETIIAQRLVRRVCTKCKTEDKELPVGIKSKIANDLKLKSESDVTAFKGKGCEDCNQTGYYGRTAIHEILVVSEDIKQLILRKISSSEIKNYARAHGMKTLAQDGWLKVLEGLTTPQEVINVAGFETELGESDVIEDPVDEVSPTNQKESTMSQGLKEIGIFSNRSFSRVHAHVEVRYRIYEEKGSRDLPWSVSESINFSAGGLLLRVSQLLLLGTVLEVQFDLEGEGKKSIQCLGRVVRVEETEDEKIYGAGILFLDLTRSDRIQMNDFVARAKQGRGLYA